MILFTAKHNGFFMAVCIFYGVSFLKTACLYLKFEKLQRDSVAYIRPWCKKTVCWRCQRGAGRWSGEVRRAQRWSSVQHTHTKCFFTLKKCFFSLVSYGWMLFSRESAETKVQHNQAHAPMRARFENTKHFWRVIFNLFVEKHLVS